MNQSANRPGAFLLMLALGACFGTPTPVCAEPKPTSSGALAATAPDLAPPAGERTSQKSHFDDSSFPPPQLLVPEGLQFEDVERRPFLYWRAWANQKLPLTRVFVFLFSALTLIHLLAPRVLLASAGYYSQKWLRCFGVGGLFFTVGVVVAAGLVRMGLYAPLGTIALAAVQLSSLFGLTVAAGSIGERTLRLLRINSLIKRPWLNGLATLWTGVVIVSLLSLIPGLGAMPRIGNRMLMLLAAAGAGAFLLSLKSREE